MHALESHTIIPLYHYTTVEWGMQSAWYAICTRLKAIEVAQPSERERCRCCIFPILSGYRPNPIATTGDALASARDLREKRRHGRARLLF